MSTTTVIWRATQADTLRVAGVIARAFHPLPQAVWLVRPGLQRTQKLLANMAMWAEHALAHGHIDVAGSFDAVAVWFDREHGPAPLPADYDERLRTDCGTEADRFRALDDAFAEHHPAGAHHHLAMLAVEPDQQHRGLGTALLRHHHAVLDAGGWCSYLEASTPGNVGLYEAHGYRRLGQPYSLPFNGPPLWPMWRDALA